MRREVEAPPAMHGDNSRRASLLVIALLVVLASQSGLGKARQKPLNANWNWAAYGGGAADGHFVPLKQINPSNVDQLKIAWTYSTHDELSYLFNPVEVDGVLYVLARDNSLVAINASNGNEIWVHGGLAGIATRGIAFWQSKDGKDKRLIFELHNQLQEIDAQTGKSILTFADNGYVDLRAGLGRPEEDVYNIQSRTPGEVYGNLIIIGSATGEQYLAPPGDIRAYDVLTGKKVWQFHTVPHPGQAGYSTWPKGDWRYAGGADAWSELSIDREHGIVYVPTGGPKYELYGGDRPGENKWSDSLIALNALTGKLIWGFQAVHHDVWDYDMCSAPQLVTIEHDGRKLDAVAAAGKTGFLYVFNRLTGKPIWPIVERPVPQSQVPGEHTWPTQPFPATPPPFVEQFFSAADINPYLPAGQKARLQARIAQDLNGPLFTPPEEQETLETPGNQGGANWGESASDPNTGMVYIIGINAPATLQLSSKPVTGFGSLENLVVGAGETPGHALYTQNCQACHGTNRQGVGAVPSLVNITQKLSTDQIHAQIQNGAGQMPAFAKLNDAQISEIISYLANPETGGRPEFGGRGRFSSGSTPPPKLEGDLVGWGGAPAGQAAFQKDRSISDPYGVLNGPPYPEEYTHAPKKRYWTGWNVNFGLGNPPWNLLTAYDLNTGTIKWQVSVGGSPGLIPKQVGAIVTASGLVFLATTDGKVRAYNANDGRLLWTGDLPAGAYGVPAMYEYNGREYLVICATSPVQKPATFASLPGMPSMGVGPNKINREYVAFALPQNPAGQ